MSHAPVERAMRADARRNRTKVLAAAEIVLAQQGAQASMREIARQAGVGLATIYRQFPTKEALFEAIVVDRVNRLLERARAAAESSQPGAVFFEFLDYAVATSTGEKALADALAQAGLDPKAGTTPFYRDLEATTGILLQRAQDAGEVRAHIALPEVLALIVSMCVTADRQAWSPELRGRVLAVVFDGLREPARASTTSQAVV